MNALHLILRPTPPQADALLDTMSSFNSARNLVLKEARNSDCFNKYKLSKIFYHQVKNDFLLPSQLAVSAVTTVVEDHKNRRTPYNYSNTADVFYDKRVVSFRSLSVVSLSTTIGRVKVNFTIDKYVLWQDTPTQLGSAILRCSPERELSLIAILRE